MIRLTLVVAALLALAACTQEEQRDMNTAIANVVGHTNPAVQLLDTRVADAVDSGSSEPVAAAEIAPVAASSSEEPVQVAVEPTWHIECPAPYEWRGQMVQDPCVRVYDN